MKTRLFYLNIVLCCFVLAGAASAQEITWKSIPAPQWGFSFQLPPDASRQRTNGRPAAGTCDVYASGGLACIVQVTPTASDALASTLIEQAIQADVKEASKLGPASRWESPSKQGDLFKGYTGQIQLKKTDMAQSAVIKSIGSELGVQSVALAPLGDETAPVLKIAVVGTADREAEVVAMAKMVSSLVTTKSRSIVGIPNSKPAPGPTPAPALPPKPDAKPWPQLKNGDIELAGTVESVSKDGKTVTMTVDTIILPGQAPITLNPKRTKTVLLPTKMDVLMKGAQIHLIGRNEGVGKPIIADAIEVAPNPPPEPKIGPAGPRPVA